MQIAFPDLLRCFKLNQTINLRLHPKRNPLRQSFTKYRVKHLKKLRSIQGSTLKNLNFIDLILMKPRQNRRRLPKDCRDIAFLAHGSCTDYSRLLTKEALLVMLLRLHKYLLYHLRIRELNIVSSTIKQMIDYMSVHFSILLPQQFHCNLHKR